MTVWDVNLVSAFGRGEGLARALRGQGFSVRVLDFSASFPRETAFLRATAGPFPFLIKEYLPAHREWMEDLEPLRRGIAFWLEDGPLELAGGMASFYREARPAVKVLRSGSTHRDFHQDWLRRFLSQWASPRHAEAWAIASSGSAHVFPSGEDMPLGLMLSFAEKRAMTFERFAAHGPQDLVCCQALTGVDTESGRITEVSVQVHGQVQVQAQYQTDGNENRDSRGASEEPSVSGYRARHWIWCLSSQETETLNQEAASRLFTRGVWRPEWNWVRFDASCAHGPWLDGLPELVVVVGDYRLPWVYENTLTVHRRESDAFAVWLKVPAGLTADHDKRQEWAFRSEAALNRRLPLAKWSVDAKSFGICPHSPVFAGERGDYSGANWKNWDWIAPERLSRLDFAVRMEREAQCFQRLVQWRTDLLKKQGVSSDSALHAP